MQIEKIERGSTRGQLDVSYGLGKYLDFFVYGTGAVDVFACPMQYLLNFFLFVPMGFLVPLLWKQYRTENHVLLFGFGTSFAIEVLQMFCGRTTDVDDLLMNTLGALIGYWMFLAAERQTSFCLLRRNKTAEAGVAVSRAFQTLAYEN